MLFDAAIMELCECTGQWSFPIVLFRESTQQQQTVNKSPYQRLYGRYGVKLKVFFFY